MCDNDYIKIEDLPDEIRNAVLGSKKENNHAKFDEYSNYKEAKEVVLSDFNQEYFSELLARNGGNIQKASRIAGISRVALYKLLERYGIESRKE